MRRIKNKPLYTPVPEGAGQWVIFSVQEIGMVQNFDKTGLVYTIGVGFESVNDTIEATRRTLWKRVSAEGLHVKSKLGKIVAAAGIDVPEDTEFDPTILVGKNLTLLISHDIKDDRTYAAIDGYAKLGKGVTPQAPQHPPDESMPEWMTPRDPVIG
jgi:hypothetical protein